jgi:hypothetical protein
MMAGRVLPWFKDGNQAVVLPYLLEVLSVEGRVEYLDRDGCRPLGKIPFGLGALPTLRPRIASRASTELINLGSLAGVKK